MKVKQSIREINAEGIDPLAVYTLFQGNHSYILESAEGGEKVARYSILGFNPAYTIKVKGGVIEHGCFDGNLKNIIPSGGTPLDVVKNLMKNFDIEHHPDSRFIGGFVGYFSYDLVRSTIKLDSITDELNEPDCEFMLARNNIVIDHKERKIQLIYNSFGDGETQDNLGEIENTLLDVELKPVYHSGRADENLKLKSELKFKSNITEEQFKKNVEAAVEYIQAADIFQVVLSQRFSKEFHGNVVDVYGNLKKINPSPYMYLLDFGDRKIVGSSPEMLVRVENRVVYTYPIAGTRKRGKTLREDKMLEAEMLSDEKERAEHVMLVDLGRNDIGRVAKFGSVTVSKFMGVEKYSHVQHIVSEVMGNLSDGKDEFDALKSIFPAGTVSGAPKVRAMEIINELELSRRGIYAGCIGYISFNHNIDTAIAIRTLVFEKNKVYVQAGAGIVADSIPESEYHESVNKAMALMKATEMS